MRWITLFPHDQGSPLFMTKTNNYESRSYIEKDELVYIG